MRSVTCIPRSARFTGLNTKERKAGLKSPSMFPLKKVIPTSKTAASKKRIQQKTLRIPSNRYAFRYLAKKRSFWAGDSYSSSTDSALASPSMRLRSFRTSSFPSFFSRSFSISKIIIRFTSFSSNFSSFPAGSSGASSSGISDPLSPAFSSGSCKAVCSGSRKTGCSALRGKINSGSSVSCGSCDSSDFSGSSGSSGSCGSCSSSLSSSAVTPASSF